MTYNRECYPLELSLIVDDRGLKTQCRPLNELPSQTLILINFSYFLKIINFIKMVVNFNLVNKEFLGKVMQPIQNQNKEIVEKYLPRKCSATSKIIGPKDHSSVQIFVPEVDASGRMVAERGSHIVLSGYIREKGRADIEIEKILRSQGTYTIGTESN